MRYATMLLLALSLLSCSSLRDKVSNLEIPAAKIEQHADVLVASWKAARAGADVDQDGTITGAEVVPFVIILATTTYQAVRDLSDDG